jgi:hypothetical protein
MKNKILLFLIAPALLIITLNSGCQYDEVLPVIPDSPPVVKFSEHILPIFNESCNLSICHGQGGASPDLSENNAYFSLINGKSLKDSNDSLVYISDPTRSVLYVRVYSEESPMPQTGRDTIIAREILAWIEDGAQNN